uniref:P-type domain-containing protein n=1 Tax=Strigamia maritima TaxID=126957 RepID=T1IW06_STRMM
MKRKNVILVSVTLIGLLVVAAITVTIILTVIKSYVSMNIPEAPENLGEFYRVDCHPDPGADERRCEERGCQWLPGDASGGADCSFPTTHGYQVVHEPQLNTFGATVLLRKLTNFTLFGRDVQEVRLDVTYVSREIVRLKFTDPKNQRHELPLESYISDDLINKTYSVSFQTKPHFGVVIRRYSPEWEKDFWAKPNQYEIPFVFDSRNPGFVFSDQFLQLSTLLPSWNVFGLGDPRHETLVHDLRRTWGLWTRETIEEMAPGAHPFLISLDTDGKASGIYLRNSHALEMVFRPQPAVTFRTIGGILDFYVFLGPTPEDVVKQYTRIVGRPTLPPYWALGLHYGKEIVNETTLLDLLKDLDKSPIPFDVVHLGHSALKEQKGLSFDHTNFPGLPDRLRILHKDQARRVIVSTWGAVSNTPLSFGNYLPLEEAQKKMILIGGDSPVSGQLNGQSVVYPDYSNQQAALYWSVITKDFYRQLEFDSIHLEKNSPLNELGGTCAKNDINFPPYKPQSVWDFQPLFTKTICLDSKQFSGLHYSLHNLYAHHQAKTAFEGLAHAFPLRRPFIITDSHAPGTGRYAAHFITNTANLWKDLKRSLFNVLELNMLGIPAVGADICGSHGNASETPLLCRRWFQLGAFYPITRIFKFGNDQDYEPVLTSTEIMETARIALNTRYELLPYLYTLFFQASSIGGTVARPMFHEFPLDSKTWSIEDQFLWGRALLISPVMEEGPRFNPVYLPKGRWFDYYSGLEVKQVLNLTTVPRRNDNRVSLHVRGGHVITIHSQLKSTTNNSFPLYLIVALDENNFSEGSLYVDDKESITIKPPLGNGVLLRFLLEKNHLKISTMLDGYDNPEGIYIETVKFWGVRQQVRGVDVNGNPWQSFEFNSQTKTLHVRDLRFRIDSRYNDIRLHFGWD